MLRWLQRIFIGHNHTWKIINQAKLSARRFGAEEWIEVGERYTLQCETCGNIKHYDTI